MNAYDFINYKAGDKHKAEAVKYDLGAVASKILASNAGKDLRQEEEYKNTQCAYFDATGACDRRECMRWMKYFMRSAIAYGLQTQNKDWIIKFLVAYDTYGRLARANY